MKEIPQSCEEHKSEPGLLTEVQNYQTTEQWAYRINLSVHKTVEGILETGRLLQRAKEALPHGQWCRMFDEHMIPMSLRTAERLMAVAKHPVISNPTHGSFFPASYRTLYELTVVPEDCLLEALNNGTITPDMHRKDVATLLPPKAEPINDPQAVIAEAVDQEVPDTDQQVSDTEPTDDPEVVTESDEHTDAELLQVQTNKQTVAEPGYVSRGLVRELHEINGLLSVCADRMGKLMVVFRLLDDPRSRSRVAGHIPDTVKILKYIRAVAEAIAETQETGDKAGTIAKRVAS